MFSLVQDVLKEKQQHIEQLLKERDLERAEITRVANQYDDVEQKLVQLQTEYNQVFLVQLLYVVKSLNYVLGSRNIFNN